jgi:hypothetical protein
LLLGLGLSLAFSPAAASAYDTCGDAQGLGNAPFLCGDAWSRATAEGAEGSDTTSAGVSFLNQVGGLSDDTSTAAGGMLGAARVEVDWGLVRAYSSADNGSWTATDFLNPESRVLSYAQGAFADIGTFSSPTLPVGTPVDVTVTMDVDGGFTDGAGGEAILKLQKVGVPSSYLEKKAMLAMTSSFVPPPFALQGYAVGDELVFKFQMTASAGTTTRVSPARVNAVADMENTGQLLIEVATAEVTLDAVSGHDYATAPEPSRALLLAGAALLLTARARRTYRG